MSPTRRRAVLAIAALLGLAAGVAVLIGSSDPEPRTADVLGQSIASGLGGDGSCDVDGVQVTYAVAFRGDPAPAGYRVTEAEVSGIAPTCEGGQVQVDLLGGSTVLATATTVAGSASSLTLTFASPPVAADVDGVHVTIAGGSIPVPSACSSMRLDTVRVGTTADDQLAGTNDRDLVFGLTGDDELAGANQNDCLDGGSGADHLEGGNQDDALLGGAGDDELVGGAGKDTLLGGEGDDLLDGGQGNDTLDGGPGWDTCTGGQGKNTLTSCEVVIP